MIIIDASKKLYIVSQNGLLYEKCWIWWTVETYQWGIEGHHYPHTDNGPPQGQPGHWRKQNKRRNQQYNQTFWPKTQKLSIWNFRNKIMTIMTAQYPGILFKRQNLIILLNIHVCEAFTHALYYSILV